MVLTYLRETTETKNEMDTAPSNGGLLEPSIEETSKMTSQMGMDSTHGMTDQLLRASSSMASHTVEERSLNTSMAESMMAYSTTQISSWTACMGQTNTS